MQVGGNQLGVEQKEHNVKNSETGSQSVFRFEETWRWKLRTIPTEPELYEGTELS